MKVLHIVPAAMNYFDDIKISAFSIVQKLHDNGIDSEIITLQYDGTTRRDKEEITGSKKKKIKGIASSFRFKSSVSLSEALDTINDYDLVHFHIPFMGAGKMILQKLKQASSAPLLVSYYRAVNIVDLLSVVISLYSQYYTTRLFKRANAITLFPSTYSDEIMDKVPSSKLSNISIDEMEKKKMKLDEDRVFEIKLDKEIYIDISIDKLINLYQKLIKDNK